MDRDLEKASTRSGELAEESERTFAPIQSTHRRPSLSHSRRSSTSGTISRALSQNGYSCDPEEFDEPPQPSLPEKDPFEVGFDHGDADPWCPRHFSKLRKWTIVIIVSQASFCV